MENKPINLNDIRTLYFLGIGGIGMSGLARYFHSKGVKVSGYDKTCTQLTTQLQAEGISVHYEENINLIPGNIDMVIYTPAIPPTNKEYQYLNNNSYLLKKRAEVLGMITKEKFTIAIAGTHGKTTITSLIAHILKSTGYKITAFIGGISKNYNSNVIISDNSDIMVVEADEYDKSFLTLNPDIAVITAMDADHLDIYKTKEILQANYLQFASQVKHGGKLIINSVLSSLFTKHEEVNTKLITYNLQNAENIRIKDNRFVFDIKNEGKTIKNIEYNIPGRHNIENAIAATIVALELGTDVDKIKKALESYKGVERRFDIKLNLRSKKHEIIYIDDYAHHPEELKACILAVKELYKGEKITGIFQPHLYSRTKDFADEFAKVLELLDELILLDIYPARELPIEGVSSKIIFDKVNLKKKTLCSKNDVLEILKNCDIEVLLTLGAGDIETLVEPITNLLSC